jgi:hypothetical protein
MDEHPIPDVSAMLPFQIAEVMFADPQKGQALMTGGADLSDIEALKDYYIASQRRLAMAGKILFPIPNRRLSKRLYRLTAETLLVWGRVRPAHHPGVRHAVAAPHSDGARRDDRRRRAHAAVRAAGRVRGGGPEVPRVSDGPLDRRPHPTGAGAGTGVSILGHWHSP